MLQIPENPPCCRRSARSARSRHPRQPTRRS